MFDKSKLPDPLDYFQGRGQKIFSKNAKQFRTTCALHGGDGDTLSVQRESGLWHCFSCLAGGDIPAYEMKATGADFVTAAKALGAWIEDSSEPRKATVKRPMSLAEAAELLQFEHTVLAIVEADKRRNAAAAADLERAHLARQRITKIQGAFQP